MFKSSMSLIDVLEPPMNLWLRKLGRRSAELPVGVRIVRFSEGDDETLADIEEPREPRVRRERETCVAA
jgi:hypothetical protein